MRYAFIFMNEGLPDVERTSVRDGQSEFVGVRSLSEACSAACSLVDEGVGCIELCGAFGEDGARAVMEATGRRVPVGYIVQLPELRDVCERAFRPERSPFHRCSGTSARSQWDDSSSARTSKDVRGR